MRRPRRFVTAVASGDASVAERYHYAPYGRTTFLNASFTPHGTQNTTINQQHLYTGRQRDAESELYTTGQGIIIRR